MKEYLQDVAYGALVLLAIGAIVAVPMLIVWWFDPPDETPEFEVEIVGVYYGVDDRGEACIDVAVRVDSDESEPVFKLVEFGDTLHVRHPVCGMMDTPISVRAIIDAFENASWSRKGGPMDETVDLHGRQLEDTNGDVLQITHTAHEVYVETGIVAISE